MIKLTQLLNELSINIPRASMEQLKRWKAKIKKSDDKMTKIKLALICAEGVMWIWREKYPTDNRPQAALDAVKAYIKDPSEENEQKCRDAANNAWSAVFNAATVATNAAANAAASNAAAVYAYVDDAANAAGYAIYALTNHNDLEGHNEIIQEENQLNELGINIPGRASMEQLERWEAEIQVSNDEMTRIKLALKCAEGVMWIWREKYPKDNRPQAAINAVKAYIKDPSDENAQNCEKAANAAWEDGDAAYVDAAYAATNATYAAYATAAFAADYAADYAIDALTYHQKENQLN